MTVHVDTSFLVHALTGTFAGIDSLQRAVDSGDRLVLSAIVLFEWLRGPRTDQELALQESFMPAAAATPFDQAAATRAAQLYRSVGRARRREVDIAIAACAIEQDAALWTLNREDFNDIPGLTLYDG
ncbi:MAG: type II toxin-antitoxin system VapC family toxin [Acidobacteria bacterium]|nr:type II toxin-antitoxin system VapC family toxin [Acidobacteriota bacterium]